MKIGTLSELFAHHDWARERLMAAARSLSDAELDRPFDMGEGSLRRTLQHFWEAEEVWLRRWQGTADDVDPAADLGGLSEQMDDTAARRNRWLAGQTQVTLAAKFDYRRRVGPASMLLGVSALHVCNHAIHHRGQALNMLKHLGVSPLPTVDYIVMRMDGSSSVGELDSDTLKIWWEYSDWAQRSIFDAAGTLNEGGRSLVHPIGPGSLRRILRHLADATAWWMDNIEQGPGTHFPALDESDPWDVLWERYATASVRVRNVLDRDLHQVVEGTPRPGVRRSLGLGVVLIQLCAHGTHHRAQALNILRHSGGPVPPLDLAHWELQKQAV